MALGMLPPAQDMNGAIGEATGQPARERHPVSESGLNHEREVLSEERRPLALKRRRQCRTFHGSYRDRCSDATRGADIECPEDWGSFRGCGQRFELVPGRIQRRCTESHEIAALIAGPQSRFNNDHRMDHNPG
jgi:hypothetical protein